MKPRPLLLGALLCSFLTTSALSQEKLLKADARSRPPEMVLDEKTGSIAGPLIEIFDAAAKKAGYAVEWRSVPFPRSLAQLGTGETDIVPRLIRNEEREAFAEFLGPIGKQPGDIEFLVKAGRETALKSYEDLKKIVVGVKPKTIYFEQFDKDTSIKKVPALNDDDLARMLNGSFVDAVIVIDKPAIEKALAERNIKDTAWASYKVPTKWGIYYGMGKSSKHAAAAEPLSQALRDMAKSGRVTAIYKKYNATPPLQ